MGAAHDCQRASAIFLYTWNGGKLNGVQITDNMVVWDPTCAFRHSNRRRVHGRPAQSVRGQYAHLPSSILRLFEIKHHFSGNHYCAPDVAPPPAAEESDPSAKKPDNMCNCLRLAGQECGIEVRPPGFRTDSTDGIGCVLVPRGVESKHVACAVGIDGEHVASVHITWVGSRCGARAAPGQRRARAVADRLELDSAVEMYPGMRWPCARPASLIRRRYCSFPFRTDCSKLAYPVSPADVWLQIEAASHTARDTAMPACGAQSRL